MATGFRDRHTFCPLLKCSANRRWWDNNFARQTFISSIFIETISSVISSKVLNNLTKKLSTQLNPSLSKKPHFHLSPANTHFFFSTLAVCLCPQCRINLSLSLLLLISTPYFKWDTWYKRLSGEFVLQEEEGREFMYPSVLLNGSLHLRETQNQPKLLCKQCLSQGSILYY